MSEVYRALTAEDFGQLIALQSAYKTAIGETAPTASELDRLREAVAQGNIVFYGCEARGRLVGVCSVCKGFSTFNYQPSGVFEDFYILPEFRHQGMARRLARFAWENSGVGSMTVGCADCDRPMYEAIGFTIPLGNLLAWGDETC